MFSDLLSLPDPEVIGQRAWDDMNAVHSMDRHFTFASFRGSARDSAERLRAGRLSRVEIIKAPADRRSV